MRERGPEPCGSHSLGRKDWRNKRWHRDIASTRPADQLVVGGSEGEEGLSPSFLTWVTGLMVMPFLETGDKGGIVRFRGKDAGFSFEVVVSTPDGNVTKAARWLCPAR